MGAGERLFCPQPLESVTEGQKPALERSRTFTWQNRVCDVTKQTNKRDQLRSKKLLATRKFWGDVNVKQLGFSDFISENFTDKPGQGDCMGCGD